jgi:putative oxidoreductase
LVIGFGFVYHGFPKLFSSTGHQGFVGMLQMMGVPAPGLMAWLVGIVELVGGLALLVGALVQLAAIPLIIDMLVAMFAVHLPQGFNFMNIVGMTDTGPQFGMPGYEVNLLYIAGLVTLMLGGAGALSVEERMRTRRAN